MTTISLISIKISENICLWVTLINVSKNLYFAQTVDKALLLQGFAIAGTAFLI